MENELLPPKFGLGDIVIVINNNSQNYVSYCGFIVGVELVDEVYFGKKSREIEYRLVFPLASYCTHNFYANESELKDAESKLIEDFNYVDFLERVLAKFPEKEMCSIKETQQHFIRECVKDRIKKYEKI